MVKMNVVIVDSDLNSFMGEVTSIKDCCFLVSDFISKYGDNFISKYGDNCSDVSITLYSEGKILEALNIADFINNVLGVFCITISKVEIK